MAAETPSWVDRMRMVPLSDPSLTSLSATPNTTSSAAVQNDSDNNQHCLEFNIASFNVLAESYLTPRSHPGLPENYATVAFDPVKRRQLLLDTLERFCSPPANKLSNDTTSKSSGSGSGSEVKWDILALQEMDLIQPGDPILPAFESWGYQVVRTSSKQRKDCCAIAFDRSKFSLVEYEVIQFDDLATLQNTEHGNDERNDVGKDAAGKGKGTNNTTPVDVSNITPKRSNSPPELTGMVRSFLRRNCAVVAHLKSIETKQSLIVASAHLYWHPGYEYVKLCQAKYLMDRVAAFASKNEKRDADTATSSIKNNGGSNHNRVDATIICGDINSKPGSIVHELFVKPHVDARSVAPWHYFWDQDNEVMYTEEAGNDLGDTSLEGGDRKDGQDPIVAENGGDDSKRQVEGGYTMSGMPEDFAMYCTTIESNNESSNAEVEKGSKIESKVQETSKPESDSSPEATESNNVDDDLNATLAWRRLNKHNTPQDYQHSKPPLLVKYKLDYTLNRFTRWLRMLGIDATLETIEEEKERTSGGKISLFDDCKNEKRTLITTSYKLLLRKECPAGAYLLNPKSTSQLENVALPLLLRTHGFELLPCTFLTRCVVCNGGIHRVATDEEKRNVFIEFGAPMLVDSGEVWDVFRCDGCRQGYWWDDRPSSSASRVFTQATKLLRICLRKGVGLKDEGTTDVKKRKENMGAFDFVDVAKERQSEDSVASEANTELSLIEWLREGKLSSPFNLKSAYASPCLPFTNVTKEFVGCLDYVFFETSQFDQICKLNVPTSFRDMNSSGANQGHLIPSDIWPSDHIAVGARLRLKSSKVADESRKNDRSKATPPNGKRNGINDKNTSSDVTTLPDHSPRCACGCVPNILSLFEMAELRKKHREKKAAEAASKLLN